MPNPEPHDGGHSQTERSAEAAFSPIVLRGNIVEALADANLSCVDDFSPAEKYCSTDRAALLSCSVPDASDEPEAHFSFRRPVPILPVGLRALEPEEIGAVRLELSIDKH